MSEILVKFPPRNHIIDREIYTANLHEKLKGRVKEAWLFGSVARGDFSSNSDIDLILVVETPIPFHQRVNDFSDILNGEDEMDIFIYTPDEFENQMRRAKDGGFWKSVTDTMIRVV